MKKVIGLFLCAALVLSVFTMADAGDREFDKLKKKLYSAVKSSNGDAISEALIDVLVHGGRDAVELLVEVIEKIPASEDVIYWQLVKGVSTVTDREAMVALAEAVVDHRRDAIGRDLLFALQNNRCKNVAIVHQAVIEKCGYDMQKMSIESLVNMEEDETAVDALIASLAKVRDRDVKAEIIEALRLLTRADCGEDAEEWRKWWEVSRENGLTLGGEKKAGGGTGTVVDDLDRTRRDQLFGDENAKLKALVITDY